MREQSGSIVLRSGRGSTGLLTVLLATGLACAGVDAMRIELRQEGQHFQTFPAEVAEEYGCDERKLPFFEIESAEVLPERVAPGGRLNHRIVYVVCPARPTEVVAGSLELRVLFRGDPVHMKVISEELQPGRWMVDRFIPISESAEPGVYALEVKFNSEHGRYEHVHSFLVTAP